ncbi:hypothetical protein EW146_g7906 [Bondarzewia mesenterica]|uniref:N-acetylglucosamine-6-phosphate deacetylase n=1 Tax=Bondarzewia mesenterica TaxID=1095465 RepID=A0A4V3XE05_9AGAM|nr:hypothetical protein EW146_g7906 [Bondarzewia mesenterica]
MTSSNGLLCFTNCLIPLEDGSLVQKDLWIDERRGVILDSQRTFYQRKERPAKVIDLGGNIISPGFLDIQINGAYGFDFSVYEGDDEAYRQGLKSVSEKIVETGVTSLVPTIITQEKSLYPSILNHLRPFTTPNGATLLGWHAEGPFLQMAKRGAHAVSFLRAAHDGFASFEEVYGAANLAHTEDWLMSDAAGAGGPEPTVGVRIITAAPEIEGVMDSVEELTGRGVIYSIGHRHPAPRCSIATTDIATAAVCRGARLITHLFNAMPQLHHRDPSIIGLLGASPSLSFPFTPITADLATPTKNPSSPRRAGLARSEAFDDIETPPQTPVLRESRPELHLEKGQVADMKFERPFYELIVDGIHSHPNSVRLAYNVFPEGCILITDAMKILDPHLRDGVHEWRDGKRFVKEGVKLYLEGTDTLAGSVVTLDTCVRNFSRFTGCSLGEAIKCATFNPAKCLGIENKKGTLRAGADADLVVLDRKGIVLSTWVSNATQLLPDSFGQIRDSDLRERNTDSGRDPLDFEGLLTEDEIAIRDTAREFCQACVSDPSVPSVFMLIPICLQSMGSLGLLGPTIKGYGCAGVSYVAYGLVAREIERIDSGYRSTASVQSSLVMHPINAFGTEAQKSKYLPGLAKGELTGCFGLTEPNHGSDPAGMDTTAEEVDGGFVLKGSKTWISNAPAADVFVIWARCKWDGRVRGFVLEKGMDGLTAPKITNKLALRVSTTGSIFLDSVKVSHDALLPGALGLGAAFSCLNNARFGISFGVIGALEDCLHRAHAYAQERNQFGRPLASFQLVQRKLVAAQTEAALGLHASLRVGRLKDVNKAAPEMISLVKRNNCGKALEHSRVLLDILGGNACSDEYHIGRHVANLQVTNTYEGHSYPHPRQGDDWYSCFRKLTTDAW